MAAASAGTGLAWTSPVLSQLESGNSTIHATKTEITWIGSFLPIGALFGSMITGILADKIGRKGTAIAIAIPFILSWLLTVFAKNVLMLYIARFLIGNIFFFILNNLRILFNIFMFLILGISTGGSCVVAPVFISEFAETSIRGLLGTCFQLFLTIGILIIYVFGAFYDWIILSWVCLLIPCINLIGLFFIPDSPTWLLSQVYTQKKHFSIFIS